MNASLTSDEGVDTTFLSQASTSSSQKSVSSSLTYIPTAIRRAQHPFSTSWTIWYSAGNRKLTWQQNQVKVSTVSTVEQFWLLISQLKPPSDIPAGYTLSVFKEGILPDWEDLHNIEGGRWMVPCRKVDGLNKFDSKWLNLLSMMIEGYLHEELE